MDRRVVLLTIRLNYSQLTYGSDVVLKTITNFFIFCLPIIDKGNGRVHILNAKGSKAIEFLGGTGFVLAFASQNLHYRKIHFFDRSWNIELEGIFCFISLSLPSQ